MKSMELQVTVNGHRRKWTIAPGDLLLDVLRREGLFGVKRGCEKGECGACTVLVDGRAMNSCLMFAAKVEGCEVLTIEGVAEGVQLDRLQGAFLDHGAAQCGFCTPGMILAAKALLDKNPHPSEAEVREAMAGVLCRCTGYIKPVQAVLAAAKRPGKRATRKREPAGVSQ
jgi:aerobic-type carbon monoxide dehydrogenase small subunit (CoxS/CutS family)